MIDQFKVTWDTLPKTLKVFLYMAVSIILSELLIELGNIEQSFVVRIMAQLINLAIVFLQDAVPAVKSKFTSK